MSEFEKKVTANCPGIHAFKVIIGGDNQADLKVESVIKRKFQIEVNGR